MNKKMALSIVIPTLNAGDDFKLLLRQLRAQSGFSDAEIIIVDSASTDTTTEYARQYGARVISIQRSEFNHGTTRNLGVRESRGDFVCLMTQDAIPVGPNFLQTLIESIENADAAGGYARQIPRPDASPLTRRDVEAWISGSPEGRTLEMASANDFYSMHPINRYFACVFDNVASVIRRDVWEKIPFPRTPFGEDIEWACRAISNGYKLIYEPKAAVVHSHERSPDYCFQRTAIDHYLLYRLFGVRTVPSRWKAMRGAVSTTVNDLSYMAGHWEISLRWIRGMMNIPRYAWSSAWGQYHGAKAAACGAPPPVSRKV